MDGAENRLWIASPLDVDEWWMTEAFEGFALYRHYTDIAEKVRDALGLLERGQEIWRPYHDANTGEWVPDALAAVQEVRRVAYNIRQRLGGPDDIPGVIRWQFRQADHQPFSDAQLVAALAMDRACWAVERVHEWFEWFERGWAPLGVSVEQACWEPDCLAEERDARERISDCLGDARLYMTLADMLADLSIPDSAKQQIAAKALVKGRSEQGIRAGKASGRSRSDALKERNAKICKSARDLLEQGRQQHELVGLLKQRSSLSVRQLRTILTAGGVLSKKK